MTGQQKVFNLLCNARDRKLSNITLQSLIVRLGGITVSTAERRMRELARLPNLEILGWKDWRIVSRDTNLQEMSEEHLIKPIGLHELVKIEGNPQQELLYPVKEEKMVVA